MTAPNPPIGHLSAWLRQEAAHEPDLISAAWNRTMADKVDALVAANRDLIAQYETVSVYVLGGAPTPDPLLRIKDLLETM